ncbi:hypothetical protein [Ruania zhangjianzhongii]|uniref:hypothetical protein n=1 Tax=Ruania zhangjianzhongii TaxID=2603206 RepID=UPI0011C8948C|nr:hypothetical protein [Ruania zhangjianzhongii]
MTRNPFGVQDVPDPDGADVKEFARNVRLTGPATDDNAPTWADPITYAPGSIAGRWSSRWYSDRLAWRRGHARLSVASRTIYLWFDWDDGACQGLIEARDNGDRWLVGRYLNLSAPEITRPWVGLIVNHTRIDGAHTGGRIDFRR